MLVIQLSPTLGGRGPTVKGAPRPHSTNDSGPACNAPNNFALCFLSLFRYSIFLLALLVIYAEVFTTVMQDLVAQIAQLFAD